MTWAKIKLAAVIILAFIVTGLMGVGIVTIRHAVAEPPTSPPVAPTQSAVGRPATQPATTQRADSVEQAMLDFIAWVDQKTVLLQGIRDADSAKAAAESLKSAPAETKALFDRQMQLMKKPIDPTVQQELEKKYGDWAQKSIAKLQAEIQRIDRDPAIKKALGKDLDTAWSVFNSQAQSTRPAN